MLFLRNKVVKNQGLVKALEPPEPIKTTIQVLTEIRDEQEKAETTHTDKIHALIDDASRCFSEKGKKILQELGFHVFIQSQWIGRFLYHANVFSPRGRDDCVRARYDSEASERAWRLGDAVNFKGDIPDSVLDKALLIKDTGFCAISIHSMNSFPVEFVKCDPILIGWAYSPHIQLYRNGKFDTVWVPNAEGVIISIWDYDKEIPALG